MPKYEYRCKKCGAAQDEFHSYKESPTIKCEACNTKMERAFVPVPIIFKGSGFYVTDNKCGKCTTADSKKSSDASSAPACGASGCADC